MNAVTQKQSDLLVTLMKIDFLKAYYLAGGTNLALRENHRKSIDLDLFINREFNIDQTNYLNKQLKDIFGTRYVNTQLSEVGIFSSIDAIKVDFVNFPYPLLRPLEYIDNNRLASKIDIAAMKINAIVGRGSKKDFYDIEKLLDTFNIQEMLLAYQTKFKVDNLAYAEKSLVYFSDANNTKMTNNQVISLEKKSWKQIQATIIKAVKEYKNKKA